MNRVLLGDVPEANAARLGPHRWALRHDQDELTWGALANRSLRRAHALASAGLRRGDFVVLALPNSNDLFELTFAIWKLGGTPAVVSHRLPKAELQPIVETIRPRLVIAHSTAIDALAGARSSDFGRDHPDQGPMKSLESPHLKAMTSGGSTGRPKVIIDHNTSRIPAAGSMIGLPEDGVVLNPAPLYHNMPFATSHMALLHGNSLVGMARFDAARMLELIERFRVEWVTLVPTMMNRVTRLPAEQRYSFDLSSLKTVWHTAAPIAPWLKQAWIDWLGPERIWEVYGGTEGFGSTQLNGVEWLAHRGSVGRPRSGELVICDDEGTPLQAGEVGEVFFRPAGASVPTYHYLGAEPRKRPGGLESFGDYGWLDKDGYLYIADRRTDLILSGGSNIYPAEVEAALMEHPAVESAIVIGLPHADLGAVPHAIIQLEDGSDAPSEDELRTFVAERLLPYKTPRSYEFTAEPLRNEAGKARRSQLRAERIGSSNPSTG
jgi:bile acid-coenzyme A ligase